MLPPPPKKLFLNIPMTRVLHPFSLQHANIIPQQPTMSLPPGKMICTKHTQNGVYTNTYTSRKKVRIVAVRIFVSTFCHQQLPLRVGTCTPFNLRCGRWVGTYSISLFFAASCFFGFLRIQNGGHASDQNPKSQIGQSGIGGEFVLLTPICTMPIFLFFYFGTSLILFS